jgi:DNA repair protein RadC
VFALVQPRLAGLRHEVALAVALDRRAGLIAVLEVARGGQDAVALEPRDVLGPLLRVGAAGFVLVHNHPSGDARPSHNDVEITRHLARAGELVGLPLIDHLVIGAACFRSLAEELAMEVVE